MHHTYVQRGRRNMNAAQRMRLGVIVCYITRKFKFSVQFLASALLELMVEWGSPTMGSWANKVLSVSMRKIFD